MIGMWKPYFFSIIVCALTCGILSQIISDRKRNELMHLISGIVMAIVILKPIAAIDPGAAFRIPAWNWDSADFYIAEGEKTAMETKRKCIKASCETYILDKAKAIGADIITNISLDEGMIPVAAEIIGECDAATKVRLQEMLMMDLGIPKENQKWIWNQESNS